MVLLILGVGLWAAAHFFKRLMPQRRAALGSRGKGIVAAAIAVSIVLMIFGYRAAPDIALWTPPGFAIHINNLLVLVAIFMMSPAPKKGRLLSGMRHPMLTGFVLWAGAHLLVNGDLASLVLFGGLALWAVLSILVINRAEPDWSAPPAGPLRADLMFLAASLVLMAVIGWIHGRLGAWPFPG